MARLSNQEIIGNIGAAPEYRHKEGQNPFCVFTVAVDRPKKKNASPTDPPPKPIWFRVTLWAPFAETAVKMAYSGMPVYVTGRFDVSEWTDKQGVQQYTLEIAATNFQMLGESPTATADKIDAAISADRRSQSARGGATPTDTGVAGKY